MEDLLANLQKLGFSQYESRAYVACLRNPQVSAYELAKHSGIPPSKIYEVVDRLVGKDLLVKVEENGSSRYVGLAPSEVMGRYRRSYTSILDEADRQLKSIAVQERAEETCVWNLTGRDDVLDRCGELLGGASDEVYLAVWPDELRSLEIRLAEAESRGVAVAVCLYGPGDPPAGRVFHHATKDIEARDGNARRLVVVVDGKEALLGYFPRGATATGHWSRNPGFVQMTKDYIRHDMWITEVMERSSGILTGFRGRGRREMRELLDSGLPGPGAVEGVEDGTVPDS